MLLAACGCVVLQYSVRTLRLLSVSEALPQQITLVAASPNHTFAVCDRAIHVLKHNRKVS